VHISLFFLRGAKKWTSFLLTRVQNELSIAPICTRYVTEAAVGRCTLEPS
jgi:hypothetical protein